MKFVAIVFILSSYIITAAANTTNNLVNNSLIEKSQQLLLKAKLREPTDIYVKKVEEISEQELLTQLLDDTFKKAFWINVYNAFTQIFLYDNPGKYPNLNVFFSEKQVVTGGQKLSLNDIEHGILKHSKIVCGLGYLNQPFPSQFEKRHRVERVNHRIHFSLNCGAESCPPIAFYSPEQLDNQLESATKVYLQGVAEYDEKNNAVALPALMSWFRADFGGKREIIKLLHTLQLVPADKILGIIVKKYNWDLYLENYKQDQEI